MLKIETLFNISSPVVEGSASTDKQPVTSITIITSDEVPAHEDGSGPPQEPVTSTVSSLKKSLDVLDYLPNDEYIPYNEETSGSDQNRLP